jgi:hypothetical protein
MPLENVSCARLPLASLPALAGLRCRPGVTVRIEGASAWLRWPVDDEGVRRCVQPLAGAELYEIRDGVWYRPGRHLPAFEVADEDGRPLEGALFPAPVEPEPPPVVALSPQVIRLAPADRPRAATVMHTPLAELGRWADTATTAQLAALRAARSGDRVLLLGRPLPALPGGLRLWGERLLVPLGFRPEPAFPESTLLEALGVGPENLVLLTAESAEVVPRGAFEPLTRAAVRLACSWPQASRL